MTRSNISRIAMAVISLLVALASVRYAVLDVPDATSSIFSQIKDRHLMFLLHISISAVALAVGALQFFKTFRKRFPLVHRIFGRIYAISVLIGGVAGFSMALGAKGGVAASTGFGLLSILWVIFTVNAVRHVIGNNRRAHGKWMIRSFALTFAAVTLRLYLVGFAATGMSYTEASPYLAWMCWVPNLLIVEWWLHRRP